MAGTHNARHRRKSVTWTLSSSWPLSIFSLPLLSPPPPLSLYKPNICLSNATRHGSINLGAYVVAMKRTASLLPTQSCMYLSLLNLSWMLGTRASRHVKDRRKKQEKRQEMTNNKARLDKTWGEQDETTQARQDKTRSDNTAQDNTRQYYTNTS